MFALLAILTLLIYMSTTYYAFSAFSLTKAFTIVSGSTTVIACTFLSLSKVDPHTVTPNDLWEQTSHPYVTANPIKLEPEIDYLSVIRSTDVKLSNIRTRQWGEGNSLWVFNGIIKNNSQYPINSIKLELMLSDCGLKNKKEKCVPFSERIFVEIIDLDIKPNEKGQFTSTYAVENPNHLYKLKTSFINANSTVKKTLEYASRSTNKEDMNFNVDRMVICGGESSVDQPDYQRLNHGGTMLANKEVNHGKIYRGC